MGLKTIDVLIPSAGRSTLPKIAKAWADYARGETRVSIQPILLCDGEFSLPSDLHAVPFPRCGHPGTLIAEALKLTESDYFVHGFDDDPPARVGDLVLACEAGGALWASSRVQALTEDGRAVGVAYDGLPNSTLLARNTVPLQGCVFHRDVLATVPFLELETPWNRYDWDFVLRAFWAGLSHVHVNEVLGWWTLNPDGITSRPETRDETIAWQERRRRIGERPRARSRP